MTIPCLDRFFTQAYRKDTVLRVLLYNLFLLFKQQFLGRKERGQQLKTLRYKYLVLPAQMGRDGREPVLRISVMGRKVRAKLCSLFARISLYVPQVDPNCSAVGPV